MTTSSTRPDLDPDRFEVIAVPALAAVERYLAAARAADDEEGQETQDATASVYVKHLLDGQADLASGAAVVDRLAEELVTLAAAGFVLTTAAPVIELLPTGEAGEQVEDPGPLPPIAAEETLVSADEDEADEALPVLYPKYDLPAGADTLGELVHAARHYAAFLRGLHEAGYRIVGADGHVHLDR